MVSRLIFLRAPHMVCEDDRKRPAFQSYFDLGRGCPEAATILPFSQDQGI
jgi:hypothetical protein